MKQSRPSIRAYLAAAKAPYNPVIELREQAARKPADLTSSPYDCGRDAGFEIVRKVRS